MRVLNPARRDEDAQGTMSRQWIRGRMRGFPFGTFSSFNSLPFDSMTEPSAEREAPHATSPVAIENCSMKAHVGKIPEGESMFIPFWYL